MNNVVTQEIEEKPNYTNKCQHCRSDFETDVHNKYYCSDECKSKLTKNHCVRCDGDFYWMFKKKYCSDECKSTQCIACNRTFIGRTHHEEKYCSDECKITYLTKKCKYCEDDFYSPSGTDFCSSDCKKQYNRQMRHKAICKNCKMILTYGSDFFVPEFCSYECRMEYTKNECNKKHNKKKKPTEQEIEGIIRHRVESLMKRQNDFIHSDSIGLNNYLLGGFTESLKEAVLERDEHSCFVCESNKSLEVHHILKQTLGGNNDMDNLVTLCIKCHRAIETTDLEYAIRKCIKNAKYNFGYKDEKKKEELNNTDFFNLLLFDLNRTFKLIKEDEDSTEYLTVLCEVINLIEDKLHK